MMSETQEHYDAMPPEAQQMLDEWLEHEDTPRWSYSLITSMAPRQMSTYRLFHIRADIELCISILEEDDPAAREEWAQNPDAPDWFREVMVAFSFATSRFAVARIIADLQMLHQLASEQIWPDEDDR